MLKQFFSSESKLMQVLGKLGDDIVYSLLTVLLSLPIVTAEAAWAASYETYRRLHEEEGTGIREWFSLFAEHFKRAFLVELSLALPMAVLCTVLWLQRFWEISFRIPLFAVLLFAILSILLTMVFATPILVRYPELSVFKALYNAFRYSVGYLPRSICILIAASIPFAVYAVSYEAFYYVGFLWIFFYPGWCFRLTIGLIDKLL